MRVLFIHTHYQQFGGEDAVVDLERETLTKRGIQVRMYARHNDEIKSYSLIEKALIPLSAIHSTRTATDVRKTIDAFRPDVAYIHNIYPLISPTVYTALAQAKVPVVQLAHNFRPFCSNGLLFTNGTVCEKCLGGSPLAAVVNRCFRGSVSMSAMYAAATFRARRLNANGLFICPTPFTAGILSAAGIDRNRLFTRPHFLYTGVRPTTYGAGTYALYLGRLAAEKGLNTLIDAFASTPELKLVIAGTGPMQEDLRRRILRQRLSNVQLAGFVSGEEKARLLEDAMFVVLPSESYEAFGMTALEAYRAGKPVIASNIGGLPYLVKDGRTGRLFEPGDARGLAACSREMAGDERLRFAMGRAARSAAEREYSADRWFERTIEIFRSAMRTGAGGVPQLVPETVA